MPGNFSNILAEISKKLRLQKAPIRKKIKTHRP